MTQDSIEKLARQRFVALTTFKRNGEGVSTPMWIGRDGTHLFVWTHADSWKVKRVGNDPRITLVPSGRTGKVRAGAQQVTGTAEVLADQRTVDRLEGVIRRKYGIEYRIVTTIERLVARGRKQRVILRIALGE